MVFAVAEGGVGSFPGITLPVSISLVAVLMVMVLRRVSVRRAAVPAALIVVCVLSYPSHIYSMSK